MGASDPAVTLTLPRFAVGLRPLIDAATRMPASVQTKLRAGFLFGALLLVAMAALSVAVQDHIAGRVDELNRAEERLDDLRQMDYLITAQSHYRTMSLLTHDDSYVQSIAQAKAQFLTLLDAIQPITPESETGVLARIREADQRFDVSGQQVLQLYRAGKIDDALQLHLGEEHPISHEIEGPMAILLDQAEQQMAASRASVTSDQALLSGLFVAFSVVSLVTALLLGFVLSWSFLLPLDSVHRALARMASGHFDEHLELANKDEFGALASNINRTSQELATMYGQLEDLNAQLQGTNINLLAELRARVEELDRSRGLITEAEERMRREIAEVLHSRVQNRLLTVWYRLEEVQDLLDSDTAGAHHLVTEIREQVDQIREQDVRELSHRLHPSIIRAGIVTALESLADETPRIDVQLIVDETVRALDDPAENALPDVVRLTGYRVVEESLGNVVKHAEATQVTIHVTTNQMGLELEIVDNGRGFDQQRAQPGLGLGSMAARVGRLGGSWTIHSAPGHGTRVSVVLPYSVEQVQHGVGTEVALGQEDSADANRGRAVTRNY